MTLKKFTVILGLILTALIIAWQLAPNGSSARISLNKIEGILYDARLNLFREPFTQAADLQAPNKIVIIDIDEKSIKEQGRFPWSRAVMAKLVDGLFEANVAVVAFDIMFSESQVNPVDTLLTAPDLTDQTKKQLLALKSEFDADKQFAQSLSRGDVVLAMLLDNQTASEPYSVLSSNSVRSSVQLEQGIAAETTTAIHKPVIRAAIDKLNLNPDETLFALNQGFINSMPDDDGSIRKAALLLRHQGTLYPSLALEAVRSYSFEPVIQVETRPAGDFDYINAIWLNQKKVPTDAHGRIWVPYQGKQASFPYISATDVITGRANSERLAGSIAFVGTSAAGLADLIEAPVGMQYPGVEVHANVAYGLLNPEILLVEPDSSDAMVALFLLSIGLVLSLFLVKFEPVNMLLVGVVTLIASISINLILWRYYAWVLPLTSSVLLVFSVSLINIVSGYLRESFQKNKIKTYFEQYVPAAHIDKMLAAPEQVSLAGERKQMTVLFADIRDFTHISEQLSANQVKLLLNAYLSPITKVILENHGTIDKYVGDMVMAFWGAPLNDDEHAEHAVKAALAMLDKAKQLNLEFAKKGWPEIKLGIGINTGEMNVGDMGSEFRRAYTVIGDSVNLASRLESLTKYYGVDILISEQTYYDAHAFDHYLIDKVKVKGKQKAIEVYQPNRPLSKPNQVLHHRAYQAYFAQDWQTATALFTQLHQNTQDNLYAVFIERIQQLSSQNLNEWDGSYTHQTK